MPSLLEGVRYETVKSRKLTSHQLREIVWLLRQSVPVDYPGVKPEQLKSYESKYRESVVRPNRSVGSLVERFLPGVKGLTDASLTRPNQAYARARTMLAIKGDMPVAVLTEADNGSSEARWPLNLAEIYGKLYVDKKVRGEDLMEHRFIRLGHVSMSPRMHEAVADDPTQANPLDVMIALAAHNKDERQQFRTYPWTEEEAWLREIATLGMSLQEGEDRLLRPFGTSGPQVNQESYMNSVPNVRELAFGKPGVEAATQFALRDAA